MEPASAVSSSLLARNILVSRVSKAFDDFFDLARVSQSPTLKAIDRRDFEAGGLFVFGAFADGLMVGCGVIKADVKKQFETPLGLRDFPIPNMYFGGAFVLPSYRRMGIGTRLSQARLCFVERHFRPTTIVMEMRGNGQCGSVHGEARSGYYLYKRFGFQEIGFSVDEDAGKVLIFEMI